ncbi:MAG: MATE family efflux transporter [Candidatus Bathyarchaeia archaeon]|nr:MATE family efflux transporter [Candidatus Bathyarchaeota archaeon]
MAGDESRRLDYQRAEAMGREKISRLLARFSVPAIIANEGEAFYELFDAIWCGRIGTEALAALTVAGPLMAIYRAIGAGIAVGSASLVARRLGAGKRDEANKAVCNSITLFFVVSGLATLICLLGLGFLIRLFGATEDVFPYAYSYMFVETCSMPVDFFLVVAAELVRAQGSPAIASAGLILSNIADLVWSPILVFGVGPFPALGIAGAALGTLIGRAIGSALLTPYLAFKTIYRFKLAYFKPDFRTITEIYSVGASSTLRMIAVSISQILACIAASSFGTIPLAVLGVLFRINRLNFAFCTGLSQAVVPLVGYNYGAQKKERIREIVVKAISVGFAWGTLWYVAVMLFPTQTLLLFTTDPEFLSVGVSALQIFAITFLTMSEVIISAFFQGIGKATSALIVTSARQFIFLIPCLLTLPYLLGLNGLWLAYPVAGMLALTLGSALTFLEFQKLKPNKTST